ncbi:MAG: hypothetical protein IPJ46_10880 [Anaerolineales bacterium]|nr:hypothetical protein [Anaerolineales bacterium]
MFLSALGDAVNGATHLLDGGGGLGDAFGLLGGAERDLLNGGGDLAGGFAGLFGCGGQLGGGDCDRVCVFGDLADGIAQTGDHLGEGVAEFIFG